MLLKDSNEKFLYFGVIGASFIAEAVAQENFGNIAHKCVSQDLEDVEKKSSLFFSVAFISEMVSFQADCARKSQRTSTANHQHEHLDR